MERRLAAIMMLDFIGYGRLAEADETAAVALLKTIRRSVIEPAVARDGGKILKLMGDGMLLEFSSIVGALNCGLEIQKSAPGLIPAHAQAASGLRIGINLCDLIEDEGDIYGEDVNVAARLEQSAPKGAVRITDDTYRQVRRKIDATYVDRGPMQLKHIADPIGVYDVYPEGADQPAPFGSLSAGSDVHTKKPSIAVLPLDNLSGDAAEDYFSEGVSEDIITELSKFHSLDVLARHSSFAFKAKSLTIPQIGEKLQVDYVVEGSVRRHGSKLRLVAQLIDAKTGKHVWAETYDEDLEAIFKIEDQIVSKIVGQLESSLLHERLQHSVRAPLVSAAPFDLWLRARRLMEDWTPQGDLEAEALLKECLALDPNFSRAHAGLAGVYNSRNLIMPGVKGAQDFYRLAMTHARKATDLDPKDGQNHIHLGWSYLLAGRHRKAEQHFVLAESMNPNDATILIACGLAKAYLGDPAAGEVKARRAIDLNPLHPDYYLGNLAFIQFLAGDYDACLETIASVPTIYPELAAWRAAAYALAGDEAGARKAADEFRRATAANWHGESAPDDEALVSWLNIINAFAKADDRARFLSGLKTAGLDAASLA